MSKRKKGRSAPPVARPGQETSEEVPMKPPGEREERSRPPEERQSMRVTGVVVDPSPTLGMRIFRLLPRVALLLFVFAMLIVFRGVLLPFALAVFLAFLLYPVISLLENGHLGRWRWRMPRWLAVITVYTVLFTGGYYVVPRVVVSLAAEVGQLTDRVPDLFQSFGAWQQTLNEEVDDLLEVSDLPAGIRISIGEDLKNLQTGTLKTSPSVAIDRPADETEPVPPAESLQEPGPSYSLIVAHFHFGGSGPDRSKAGGGRSESLRPGLDGTQASPATASSDEELGDAGSYGREPQEGTDQEGKPTEDVDQDSTGAEEEGEEQEPPPRFDDRTKNAASLRLLGFVREQLGREGLAPANLPALAAEQVMIVNAELLHLPEDDEALLAFRDQFEDHVRSAIRQEEFAEVVRNEMRAGLIQARSFATDQLKKATSIVPALVRGTFEVFLVLMLTAFFLIFFDRIRGYVGGLVPPQYRDDYTAVLGRINTRLSGAIRGQVIICVVNGLLTYPGVYYIGVLLDAANLRNFALLLSVVAGIFSLIPIFGVIISTVPIALLALTTSLVAALAVILWICIIHAIEAYILNPNILGHSAQMNPIIVVFALLAGQQTYGLIGALLAVPIASVIVAMFGYYRRRMARVYAAESGVEVPEDTWGD